MAADQARSTISYVTIEGLRRTAPPAHNPGEKQPRDPDLAVRVGRLENLLLDMYDLLAEHGIAFSQASDVTYSGGSAR